VERDGKSLLEWIRIHSLRGRPGLAGPELGFSRTPAASVLRNDACFRLPARNITPLLSGAGCRLGLGGVCERRRQFVCNWRSFINEYLKLEEGEKRKSKVHVQGVPYVVQRLTLENN
jgi:hypothetical protein